MKECCGIFGRILGHKFREFTIKSEPVFPTQPIDDIASLTMFSSDLAEVLRASYREEKIVRCSRCGAGVPNA